MNGFGNMKNMFGMMKEFRKFKKDPMGALASKFNLPKDIDINDTNAVFQHLLNSNQIPQNSLSDLMDMISMFQS